MIDKKYFKYCKLNEASEGIFPTYFLLDLTLSEEQRTNVRKLIAFLEDVAKRHTPPPPKTCPECKRTTPNFYADTWWLGDHLIIGQQVDLLKMLLEPNHWGGDHT